MHDHGGDQFVQRVLRHIKNGKLDRHSKELDCKYEYE